MYLALKDRKGMASFQTKPTKENPKPQDVNAGQWWRLNDMPDIGIVGDGGEGRGVMMSEKEVIFRVKPSDWVVETSPEVFEKFTNAEFNENFRMVIRDTVKFKTGTNSPKSDENKGDVNASQENHPEKYQKEYEA